MGRDQSKLLIHEIFEERARRIPQEVALYEGERSITYSDLEARADAVARGLRSKGIREGSTVGLHQERGIDWVVGALGILRSNAAVVPLPPSHPHGWLRDILAFSGLDAVIEGEDTPLDPSLSTAALPMAELSSSADEAYREPLGEAKAEADRESDSGHPDQAAFVLCSSGSTGRPKMIVRSHRSFFHRLRWTWDQHPFGAGEVGCQKAHMTTTHAIYELFEPLLAGAPVVIIPDQDVKNLGRFWEIIRKRSISRLLIVPSVLRASLDMPGFAAPPVEVLVLMGEYLHPGLAKRTLKAFPPSTRIFSIYGSTEASSTLVVDLRKSLRDGAELPLGKPISPDVRSLVLGPDLGPVEPGQAGRLHLAGSALFTEYFRDPALTASVLVKAPGQDEVLYDTHDQVRLLPDGDLQFIGRVDDTVKIRGFRIDLHEVERAILLNPHVRQATVVVADRTAGGAALAAFYVPATVNRSSVYRSLREHLPAFMVPSTLSGLDAFPLTASGKVDRVRLLEDFASRVKATPTGRDSSGGDSSGQGPSARGPSETLRRVMDVWEHALGHDRFELGDSFFEVGGDSLSVFSLVHGLHDEFGLDETQLAEESAYRNPTLRGLAEEIEGILAGRRPPTREGGSALLVTMRKGSDPDKAPFFVISSAGGTLGAYEKLVRALDTSREIIGIRDPFLWGERDPRDGFRHWAGLFLEAIRARQPQGPYFLGAYSSAGAFGYEIARRLREDDQEVALLALIDPLALDRRNHWRYGYWALRGTYMRPAYRELVRLFGWVRSPAVRLVETIRSTKAGWDHVLPEDELRRIEADATRSKGHLLSFSALLELNTGFPLSLTEADFSGRSADEYWGLLEARLEDLMPDVDPRRIRRISVQYEMQVRAQHAYELRSYDGFVLLVEPQTQYTGLLKAQLRPYVRRLRVRAVAMGTPSERTREITGRFGSLEAHFRCIRDDAFVQALANELNPFLA